MEIGETGLWVGALADERFGLGGRERSEDGLDLGAKGLVGGGAGESAGGIGDATDGLQVIAVDFEPAESKIAPVERF
ncbi:MAG: hypothetical protein ABL866_14330 [Devosia sp.]